MWMLGRQSETCSSVEVEVDFLDLWKQNVRTIEDLVSGGNLLNQRQCLDLSCKLSDTTQNIRELVLHCGASAVLFRPGLEDLYVYLEKAKMLVEQCGEKDWCTAAVFQSQNENAFREILLEVGLYHNVIYEQAKSMSDEWNPQVEDLRHSSMFLPASPINVLVDDQDLEKRLEDLVSGNTSVKLFGYFLSRRVALKQCLARYLLLKLKCTSKQSHATIDTCSAILWAKETEPVGTWRIYCRFIGSGNGASGVCGTEWMGIPCAKKEIDPKEAERFFLEEASILAHVKHPCIVDFFCCGNGKKRGDRFIVMELMQQSLFNLIGDQKDAYFPLPVVVDMIVQMARGMQYIHEQGIAHHDFKPQNVVVNRLIIPHLVDRFCVELVDFGMSKTKVRLSKSNTISVRGVGTTIYRAREVHPKAHPDRKGKAIWFKVDVFYFGMTCAHFLSL